MTQQDDRRLLLDAVSAIGFMAEMLRAHEPLIQRYLAEAERMDNIGPILDPTLFKSPERRSVDAMMRPLFKASRDFLIAYDSTLAVTTEALAKVTR